MSKTTQPAYSQATILRLAIPSLLANMTIPLVGIVDTAIAGNVSDAFGIAGIAIASTLFDLLYWNFGFLRLSTGGMTAQAYGRSDSHAALSILVRNSLIAIAGALFLWAIQIPFLKIAIPFFSCSEAADAFARQYFLVRIWAAPATLLLMTFKGWFIGMQNTVVPMVSDIVVNVVNMALSFYLAVRTPMGIIGVAYGTLIAQYSGLLVSLVLFFILYGKDLRGFRPDLSRKVCGSASLNWQFFVRSLCFIAIYVGFTYFASNHGAVQVAVSSIFMKLFMLFSYVTDGFAYAGEALTGRFIGSSDRDNLTRSVRDLHLWSIAVALVFTALFFFFGYRFIALMTDDQSVLSAAQILIPFLVVMPIISAPAFMWDGIFAGATAGADIRNCMILSAIGFFAVYILMNRLLPSSQTFLALYFAYHTHLLVRVLYLSLRYPHLLHESIR